jgi:hypothetical protein
LDSLSFRSLALDGLCRKESRWKENASEREVFRTERKVKRRSLEAKKKGIVGQKAELQNKKPKSGAGLVVGECGRIAGCKAEFPNIRNLRYDQGLYIISPNWGG